MSRMGQLKTRSSRDFKASVLGCWNQGSLSFGFRACEIPVSSHASSLHPTVASVDLHRFAARQSFLGLGFIPSQREERERERSQNLPNSATLPNFPALGLQFHVGVAKGFNMQMRLQPGWLCFVLPQSTLRSSTMGRQRGFR